MNPNKNINNDSQRSALINDLTKSSKIDKFNGLLPEIEHVENKAVEIIY